ncbi:glycosyltransferase family 2 protein [Thalassobaculum litoreum]|uniref:Glycosyltransferase, GT2 family n=1 Tax=Thalassobaculum litoreum DSM 18839 TaxID=1123362 RepID=A0A8G2BPS7_9PROT|nr:glycosyltransferase family 2 protein [Thalassobaculum litoreum]SDG62155.1 hypothetical protein SAMN05660686_05047 [Thalassobaculum litoreum DSM 18839]
MKDRKTPPQDSRTCTVIIVSYYTGPVLLDCLQAALEQEGLDGVVLVDNGNDETMRKKVDKVTVSDRRLRVLRGHGNVGFARGCNMGVATAEADYILILNPDCVMRPGSMRRAIEVLTQHPAAAALTLKIENSDGSEQRGGRRNLISPWSCLVELFRLDKVMPNNPHAQRINLHETPPFDTVTAVQCISGAFMMMPRTVYTALGGMDEDYFLHFEDVDLCLRIQKSGYQILYVPDVTVMHMKGTSRTLPLFVEWHKSMSAITYFNKHFCSGRSCFLLAPISISILLRFLLLAVPLTVVWLWSCIMRACSRADSDHSGS